jgi:hypothetical protein
MPVILGANNSGIVQPAHPASRGVVQGYRVDPMTAQQMDLPLLQGMPVEQAEKKLAEVHKGAALASKYPFFPSSRAYKDVFWILPFLGMVVLMVVAGIHFGSTIEAEATKDAELPDLGTVMTAGACGALASLGMAFGFMFLAHKQPACVVWTSLLFSPCLLIAVGLGLMFFGSAFFGILLILLGGLSLSCVFMCYRPLIPFTIKLVECISSVMVANPGVFGVSALGSLAGLAWSLVCGVTFVGGYLQCKDQLQDEGKEQKYAILFACVLIFVWGGQVIYNVCHVTYCGLFGRWYVGADDRAPLQQSLNVALTTSFGSICFGSFLIAAVRALEAVVRQARYQAQQEGNYLCCILLLVVECVVQCIGDILEYFSEWAYVQCAIRGVSFIEAARITYSMCTCANVLYIIQDLLINSVVNLAALLCAAVGCGVGAGTGFALGGNTAAASGAVIGFLAGLMAGGAAAGVLTSGAKTLLAMWAEDSEPLQKAHPDIHAEFEHRILAKLYA